MQYHLQYNSKVDDVAYDSKHAHVSRWTDLQMQLLEHL